MASFEIISKNNEKNENLLKSLQQEFDAVKRELTAKKKKELIQENADLTKRISEALAELIRLETLNGKTQILVPGAEQISIQACDAPPQVANETIAPTNVTNETKNPPKEKKPKKEKPAKPAGGSTNSSVAAESPTDVARLDLRVGKIVEVDRHPDADSLYLEKIDCGEAQPRTVVSGLVKYIPLEEMQNRMVVVLCNLKPAKMRGVTSEAMVMCASTADKVEVLSPPEGSVPGDLVHCEGYNRNPDAQLNPKKKVFETCAPDLKTNDNLVACFKGAALHVPGKGNVVAQTLKNVNVK